MDKRKALGRGLDALLGSRGKTATQDLPQGLKPEENPGGSSGTIATRVGLESPTYRVAPLREKTAAEGGRATLTGSAEAAPLQESSSAEVPPLRGHVAGGEIAAEKTAAEGPSAALGAGSRERATQAGIATEDGGGTQAEGIIAEITAASSRGRQVEKAESGPGVMEIPVEQIDRSPYQTRHKMPEHTMAELAASIKSTGVVQPVLVRPKAGGRYELIAGERRWVASTRAGKTTVPAIVRQVSNEQAAEMTIIENLQREDLNAMEQARAFEKLSREFGLTQEEMARKTGVERSTIANYLRLLKLPFEVQMNVENGPISFSHAKVLMMLTDTEQIKKVGGKIVKDALSVRQLEDIVFDLMTPIEGQPMARPAKYVDPNVRAAEQELTRMLGARVQIKDRNGRGKIVITYHSLNEFDRVLSYIVTKRT